MTGTPDILTAVWVGFDDNEQLGRGETGSQAAVPIWLDFMMKATEGSEVHDFPPPARIMIQRIDPQTGLLPTPDRPGLEEVFLSGTEPLESGGSGDGADPDKLLLGQ